MNQQQKNILVTLLTWVSIVVIGIVGGIIIPTCIGHLLLDDNDIPQFLEWFAGLAVCGGVVLILWGLDESLGFVDKIEDIIYNLLNKEK